MPSHESPGSSAKPFVLLGSGFSKAVFSGMPTLPELSSMVLQRLQQDPVILQPFAGDLEQWLSFLSTDQPWLDDFENLSNRSLFLRASSAVKEVIDQSEAGALARPYPSWLKRLVISWCAEGATVVTFNYDLLIERITTELRMTHSWADLYRMPLADRSTSFRSGGMFARATPPGSVLRLLKLHGSTNWGYAGMNTTTGDAIYLMESDMSWSTPERTKPPLPRHEGLYDDLKPMIVPPTGTKNLYYSSSGLRAQWRKAREALRNASSVTLFGYSFPATDLAARHFFAGNVPSVPITVVDRNPDVEASVVGLAGSNPRVSSFSGDNAIERYVSRACGDVLQWDAEHDDGGFVPWMEINGLKRTASGDGIDSWDEAKVKAGSLALEELASLNLNAHEFQTDADKAHWPELNMAYRRR